MHKYVQMKESIVCNYTVTSSIDMGSNAGHHNVNNDNPKPQTCIFCLQYYIEH